MSAADRRDSPIARILSRFLPSGSRSDGIANGGDSIDGSSRTGQGSGDEEHDHGDQDGGNDRPGPIAKRVSAVPEALSSPRPQAPGASLPATPTSGNLATPRFQPLAQPPVVSISLTLAAAQLPTLPPLDWQTRPLETVAIGCGGAAPAVVSVPLLAPSLRTIGFVFPELPGSGGLDATAPTAPPAAPHFSAAFTNPTQKTAAATAPAGGSPLSRPAGTTRIKPPGDIIKLEDRLFYVLQPPLESWMQSQSLEFPFQPFPYQFAGVAFLYPRHAAVLADEMGLGKTMQAITAIRLLLRTGEVRSVLLVCPKPLVTNWQREFRSWAPEIPLVVIEGDQGRRQWQWRQPNTPVRIANYELLNRDRQTLCEEGVAFDLVVLDEAQRIRNRTNSTAQVARAIRRSRNWALTGTPVENSPEDLVGIFEFLMPGHMRADMKPRRMGRLVSDYVLRRTKDQVLSELPPKLYRSAELELLPEQRESYRLAEEEGVLRLTEMGQAATIHHVFELVLRLKQICNFDPATGQSAKLERLSADLEEVAQSGKKAIIFSQWVETLERLSGHLSRFGPLEFHGRVPSQQRDRIIEQFKQDRRKHLLLLSYGAGGVGLNLQFCEYVFLFDRWWNPAVEDQAINRAHRIGAAGPVTVTRFLSLATIEQRIDQVLEQKREIFDTIFSDQAPRQKAGLTHDEIFGLFQLKCPSGPVKVPPAA